MRIQEYTLSRKAEKKMRVLKKGKFSREVLLYQIPENMIFLRSFIP